MFTRQMSILEAIQADPRAKDVFNVYGMGCVGCVGESMESIEDGALFSFVLPFEPPAAEPRLRPETERFPQRVARAV